MKKFLIFQEMKLFNLMLKNSCFLGEVFRVFHHRFFGCFHFFMFSFLQVFLGVFLVDYICLLHCCCCYHKYYGFERAFFTFRRFIRYTPSCFYQCFPGAGSSVLKVAGLPTVVWNTDPAHLFVPQCSAKGITC